MASLFFYTENIDLSYKYEGVGPHKLTHPEYRGERHDNYKTSTQERVSVLKRCVYWQVIVHNGGCQGTTRRTTKKHFLSTGNKTTSYA